MLKFLSNIVRKIESWFAKRPTEFAWMLNDNLASLNEIEEICQNLEDCIGILRAAGGMCYVKRIEKQAEKLSPAFSEALENDSSAMELLDLMLDQVEAIGEFQMKVEADLMFMQAHDIIGIQDFVHSFIRNSRFARS
jgi:hypothetical protein